MMPIQSIKNFLRPFRDILLWILRPFLRTEMRKRTSLYFIPVRFFPVTRDHFWIITKNQAETNIDENTGLAIPPSTHWRGYAKTQDAFLEAGKRSMKAMMTTLERSGYALQPGDRVFDFGCAAGRVLRHFAPWVGRCELWGADPDQRLIEWCQLNMGPHFKFITTSTFPHLPFEDNYFNLIYAHSVFTHIPECRKPG